MLNNLLIIIKTTLQLKENIIVSNHIYHQAVSFFSFLKKNKTNFIADLMQQRINVP